MKVDENEVLARRFAKCYGLEVMLEKSADEWDIAACVVKKNSNHIDHYYVGYGFPIQAAYEDLVDDIMARHRWKSKDEMQVFLDLHLA